MSIERLSLVEVDGNARIEERENGWLVRFEDHERELSALVARQQEALQLNYEALCMIPDQPESVAHAAIAVKAAIDVLADPSAQATEEWQREREAQAVSKAMKLLLSELEEVRLDNKPEPADGESRDSGVHEGLGLAIEIVSGYTPDAAREVSHAE